MGHQLAVLVEGAVGEDDAIAWPGLALAHSTTSDLTRTVSPWNSGLGKRTSSQPRLATAVPSTVSPTEMPTIRESVKQLLTSRWPNSVSVRQYSSSRCRWRGCASRR